MKILLIDDEIDITGVWSRFLADNGHACAAAGSASEGMGLLESFQPDLVLLDLSLPDASGLELLPQILMKRPSAAVLLVTGYGSTRSAVSAMKMGAENYLEKPLDLDELLAQVDKVGEKLALRRGLEEERGRQRASLKKGHLMLPSKAMQAVYAKLAQVADKSAVTVLIQGETGTGKEHIARLLHLESPRSQGPFIELHCAALPEALLESELFGFEAGAFTDAKRPKPGLFEQAQGGTLFLDEIGELPASVQAKLLKVLEQRKLRRLGSVKETDLDVRLVSATNRDLAAEVKARRFRADLYYRLNVFHLDLPPLAGRPEDIRALAAHFFALLSAEFGRHLDPPGEELLERLCLHPWPGNVRELRNTVERLVIQAKKNAVLASDLDLGFIPGAPAAAPSLKELHADIALLKPFLESCRWNKSEAARRLGVSRPTFHKLLKQAGLE